MKIFLFPHYTSPKKGQGERIWHFLLFQMVFFYSDKSHISLPMKTEVGVITSSEGILSVFQQLVAPVISNSISWAFCSLHPYCFCTHRKWKRKPGCNSEKAAFSCREQSSGVADRSSPTYVPLICPKESHNPAQEITSSESSAIRTEWWGKPTAVIWGWSMLVELHVKLVSSLRVPDGLGWPLIWKIFMTPSGKSSHERHKAKSKPI